MAITKPGADVFAPTNTDGSVRRISETEAATWASEIEGEARRGVDGLASVAASVTTEATARAAADAALEAALLAEIDEVRTLASAGLQWKEAVVVMATGNVALASGLVNGTTLNGVTLATGNRVLLTAQTAPAENGIYVVPASGAASRAADADTAAEILGMAVYVNGGTVGEGRQYVLATPAPITLGTSALTYQIISDTAIHNAAIATLNSWMSGVKARVEGQLKPIWYDHHTRTLHVPGVYGINGTSVWSMMPPSGSSERRATITSSTLTVVYIDLADIASNGASSETALKWVSTYPSTLIHGSSTIAVLGVIFSRKYFQASGIVVAPVVQNQCGVSADDNDSADLVYSGAYATALTQSGSTGLGFARGWTGTNGSGFYYGARFQEPISHGVVVYRFCLESDVADTFGSVQALLVSEAITSGNAVMNPTLERTIDSHTRVYSGVYRLTSAGRGATKYIGMWCGSNSNNQTVRAFGLQFAVLGDERAGVLSEGDWPRFAGLTGPRLRAVEAAVVPGQAISDPHIPPKLVMIEGRGYPIFVDQMFPSLAGPYMVSAASKASDLSPPIDITTTDNVVMLPTDRLGSTLRLAVHAKTGYRRSGWARNIACTVASQASVAAKSPTVLMVGDSLVQWKGFSVQTHRRLQAITGVAPTFIGTIDLEDASTPGETLTVKGEGRGGREYADYIYAHTDSVSPLPVGDEATYLGWTSGVRHTYNPFLRAAVGGDDPAKIFNGYVFDVAFYLSRFSFATPGVVVIDLGTNDITQQDPATSLAQVQQGLGIMVPAFRAACPSAKILICCNPFGNEEADARWNTEQRAAARATMGYVAALGDANVHMVPLYATVSRTNGFIHTSGTADAETGVATLTVDDPYHYGPYGVAACGEVLAQWIAALA